MVISMDPSAMQNQPKHSSVPVLHMFRDGKQPIFDLFGPTVQFFTTAADADGQLCVMKGVIPNGAIVPIHSHPDVECFFMLSGQQEILQKMDERFSWMLCKPADFIQVPSGAKHAFRNHFAEPAVSIVSTTGKLGRFFQEVGRPVYPGTPMALPTPEELQHFIDVCNRYDYWLAPPEENAAVGISIS